jgi:hypothetical protein
MGVGEATLPGKDLGTEWRGVLASSDPDLVPPTCASDAFSKSAISNQPTLLFSQNKRPVRSAYQPPASSTFLSQQTSHQQPANSTFLSEQTNTSHQPPAKRTGCKSAPAINHQPTEQAASPATRGSVVRLCVS